jgi:outer membrane protein
MKMIFSRKNSCMAVLGILVLLVSTAGSVKAQQATSDSILQQATLDNVIRYAIERQAIVKKAIADEKITEANIKSRLADWYPQVNFGYTFQHTFDVPTNIIGGNPIQLGVENTSALQLLATQNIFNRDLLLARNTKTDVRRQAQQTTTGSKIDVAVNVSKAFYDIIATEQQIKVSSENIVRLQRSLKDATARYDAGIVDKTDFKRATIALNNATAAKKSNEELLIAKTEYLKALMNYPVSEKLQITYDSTSLEDQARLDTLSLPDYTRRIEYQLLATQKTLQESNLRYQKWSYLPTASANGAYIRNFLNNDLGKLYNQSFPNSYVGLSLNWSIFQGGKRKQNIKAAEWQLAKTVYDLENVKNTVNSQYAQALASYKSNYNTYEALKENVQLAQEVYDVLNLQYREGIKTYLDVVTAETDLRSSQINYFNALYLLLASKVDVEKALGIIAY